MTTNYRDPALVVPAEEVSQVVPRVLSSPSSQYLVQSVLGVGGFGNVVKCLKAATRETVAVKILQKNNITPLVQKEVAILEQLRAFNSDSFNFVRYNDGFIDREYICLEFEILDMSLWDYLQTRPSRSLSVKQIRPVLHQVRKILTRERESCQSGLDCTCQCVKLNFAYRNEILSIIETYDALLKGENKRSEVTETQQHSGGLLTKRFLTWVFWLMSILLNVTHSSDIRSSIFNYSEQGSLKKQSQKAPVKSAYLYKSKNNHSKSNHSGSMSKKKKDWKTEKDRLLRLDLEVRRTEYRRQDFISLDKIPTWREENRSNDEEEGKEQTGGGGLTDKVSLYKGDITVLEVDAIVNAGKNLPFYLWELVDDVCFLKAAQLLNCPWLPSTVKIQKVLVLGALHK
ncbi:Homeodomain-interacting protein kinase 1 [Larimichthys crocea]|uniref:Uncharacterized protein n=1 Tax=Larimichthys crocea TaxID=215358 RepID=A0ACD3QAM1_LARCR|nr:Homeodomain-interacting protein kinase 1 [Larimichthys crocea]